jgi:hypothetical protein
MSCSSAPSAAASARSKNSSSRRDRGSPVDRDVAGTASGRRTARWPWLTLLATAVLLATQVAPASAQVAPDLGTAAPYAILGTNVVPTSGTVTCSDTGPGTAINGNVGTTFNAITNNGCTITGSVDAPVAASVVADFDAAYGAMDAANPCTGVIPTVTSTLAPGVYCSAAGTTIGAGVILTLDGSASDVWVFRVGTGGLGALTLTSAQVVMGSAANACNVYWKTAQAATLTDSNFVGTVLSGAAISMTNGSWLGRGLARTDATVTDAAPLTFAGCASPASVTVNKDFSDDSTAGVSIGLTCTSGTVTATPLNATEAVPATFTVSGANPVGTSCTATETVPTGYTADQSDCVAVALGAGCTITNTLVLGGNTITVNKDFTDDSIAAVAVSLSCTSGSVVATPLAASESASAVFTVNGALAGATCTATEAVPPGYTANQADCASISLGGLCTITNTRALLAPLIVPSLSNHGLMVLAGMLALLALALIRRTSA